MALDTREKRMNAARVGRPWMRARHAVGATDEQSRVASGHGYGGNALSPAAAVPQDRHIVAFGYVKPMVARGYTKPNVAQGFVKPFVGRGRT